MITKIEDDPDFNQWYEYYPAKSLGALMGVALRRDSEYYLSMKSIVEEGKAR